MGKASPGLVRPPPGLTRGLEPLVGIFGKRPPDPHQVKISQTTNRHQNKQGEGLTRPGETLTRPHQGFGTPGGHFWKTSTRPPSDQNKHGESLTRVWSPRWPILENVHQAKISLVKASPGVWNTWWAFLENSSRPLQAKISLVETSPA